MRIREIIIIAGLLLSLVLFGVIGVLDAMIDPTDNTDPTVREQDLSTDAVATMLLADGLANMSDGGLISIHIDGESMNRLLYSVRGKLSAGALSARSIYMEERDGRHRIFVPIRLGGFETLLSGGVTLDSEGKIITVTVSDIMVGRLTLDSPIVSLLDLKPTIVSALTDGGISSYFEENSLVVKLSREDIGKILADEVKDNPNAGLVNAMYSLLMLRTDAVEIDTVSLSDITITADLSLFGGRADTSFASVNGYSEQLLRDGLITRDDLGLVSKYYINGYSRLSEEERGRLDTLLSSEGDLSAHEGILERRKLSLVSLLIHQLDGSGSLVPGADTGFKISDDDINDMLSDIEAVGMIWQYADSSSTRCGYMAVSEISSRIDNDLIKILISFDINGYIVSISADFHTGTSPLAAISGVLGSVTVGERVLNGEETRGVFDFLSANIKEDWIYTDSDLRTLTIDLSGAFSENIILSMILSGSDRILTVCKKSALSDGGFMLITFSLF